MKIATYNVNGVNGRLPVLLRWLEERQPDIVCLQELKAPNEKFPEKAIRDSGYDVIWHGQKSWNGVAMLSRVGKIHETRRGLPGDPDPSQSRYIEAAINGILVAGLYLPNGNPRPGPKFDYKLAWFEKLIDHAAELLASGAPIVLAGDFNVMPTERDVYKPDSLRRIHPDETIYTFFDYFRNAYARNAGLRIDHLLLSPALADRLVDAQVDRDVRGWEKTSDHAPTWIELSDKPTKVRHRTAK